MKLILATLVLVMVVGVQAQWHRFPGQAAGGAEDMWRAYSDMKKANWKNSDKYFHARGNYEAAKRGSGGRLAATVISNGREAIQRAIGRGQDSAADQAANRWGRNGGNPNRYRPKGLPRRYRVKMTIISTRGDCRKVFNAKKVNHLFHKCCLCC